MSGGRTGPDLGQRQMQHDCGCGDGLVFVPRQQRRILRQLPGVDLAGCDAPQHLMGVCQLLTLAVLAARQLHPGPGAVLLAMRDGVLGAAPLLGQRAPAQAGIHLDRTTYQQINEGIPVPRSQVRPGDLVFPHAGHVQLAIGNNLVVEAPYSGASVRISRLGNNVAIRRPI